MEKKKVAIIGAGPSGLPAIRHALLYGFIPVCFEATDDIGGLWRYKESERTIKDTSLASVMKTTVINTSKEMTAYSDFPPPPEIANFMHNTVLLTYFKNYADHYGLLKFIKFKHYVVNVERTEDFEKTGNWKVTFLDDEDTEKCEIFNAVIVAVGHHAKPYIPDPWPGQHKFKGTVLHSHDYKDHKGFEDKTVVVVGFGNSGGDAAVDLSRIAKQVYLSSRRGVWLSYRLNDEGLPFDYIWSVRWFGWFRRLIPKNLLSKMVEYKLMNKFNLELYGMKPKHRFIATHPTQNDEIPTRLANGTVIMKPAIRSFTESGVYFVDDSYILEVDVVLLCTGYSINFPMVENGNLIPVENNKVNLYKYMYPPELAHKNTLAVIGMIQPLGSIMPIAEMQSRVFYDVLSGRSKLPNKIGMLNDIKSKQETMKKRYICSRRHTIQVDYLPFMDELSKLIDCTPTVWKIALRDPYLAWKLIWSPTPSYIYRIRGPHAWPGAKKALLESGERVKRGSVLSKWTGRHPPLEESIALSDFIDFFLSHSNLARLIKSKKSELSLSSSVTPVTCDNLKCAPGAIGCLYHEETNPSTNPHPSFTEFVDDFRSEEYIDIRPVQLTWEEEDLILDPEGKSRKKRKISDFYEEFINDSTVDDDYGNGYQCVHMHLNDEVYRYCMMIYAQKSDSRCIEFDGHKICCCFVNPFESACNPLLPSVSVDPYIPPTTSTSYPPSNITSTISADFHSKTNQKVNSSEFPETEDTTPTSGYFNINQRTRCRTNHH